MPFNLPLSTLQTVLESMYEYVEADEEEEEDGNIKAHIIVHQEIKISQVFFILFLFYCIYVFCLFV